MESLLSAMAFLIEAITIGGITAVILTVIGIVPIQIHHYIELHVSDKEEATRVLKSWGIELGHSPEEDEDEDDKS
jgi:hypothetical protein